MKTKIILATAVAFSALTGLAYAEDVVVKDTNNNSAVTGAAGGAVTGAIVGGPVGAVIGGAVGLAAGAAIDPPPEKVVTYVREQPVQAAPVVIQEPIAVGKPLPTTVVLTPIPSDPTYAYAIVNDQRLIVDPQTHTVVQVIN